MTARLCRLRPFPGQRGRQRLSPVINPACAAACNQNIAVIAGGRGI